MAEFAYHNSYHTSLGCSPFYALYGYNPEIEYELEDKLIEGKVPAAKDRVKQLHATWQALSERWVSVDTASTRSFNDRHTPKAFKVNDLVMLSTKNLKQKRPSKKLSHKYVGPFRVEDIVGSQAYRLTLPATYRIHPVFHVSYLELYTKRQLDDDIPFLPLPELIDDTEQYEVEELLGRKKQKGQLWYKVKWLGYGPEYNEWLPVEDMEGTQLLRDAYDKRAKRQRNQ